MESKKGAGMTDPRYGSQETPEEKYGPGRDECRKGCAACLKRTKRDSVRRETLVTRQKETSGGSEIPKWRRAKWYGIGGAAARFRGRARGNACGEKSKSQKGKRKRGKFK